MTDRRNQNRSAHLSQNHEREHNDFAPALLGWYDENGRVLPWRRRWPDLAPAYYVFLSELMLQQTVVATVVPYFHAFIQRWPDIFALAAADEDEVMAAWAGLGYYARARNLLKAARLIVEDYDGAFPQSAAALQSLPGIGPYTAGAIAAFAFDKPTIVVDGNIERVMSRYFGIDTPLPALKKQVGAYYAALIPESRRSDFPQALMDLASVICQPKSASCDLCPVRRGCVGATMNDPTILPVKPEKKPKAVRTGRAFVIRRSDGQLAVYRRPATGLLGGMLSFLSDGWDKSELALDEIFDYPHQSLQQVRHVFTHFSAEITVWLIEWPDDHDLPDGLFWTSRPELALPSLMAKILQAVPADLPTKDDKKDNKTAAPQLSD